jgi:amidohydrolase
MGGKEDRCEEREACGCSRVRGKDWRKNGRRLRTRRQAPGVRNETYSFQKGRVMKAKRIAEEVGKLQGWMVEVRRELHQNPELGLEEFDTARLIERELTALGIEYQRWDTAVVGLIRGEEDGPTVAIRADMDALPIQEETGLPFASTRPGRMHACGHDAHTTILLGAARWLKENQGALRGNVKLLFQPAEETVGGAETMVERGCLENPTVDYVFGLHVMPYLPVGRVETRKGALNGCSTTLDITVRGRGGHAAYPEKGIDAVLIAAHVVVGLNNLVARYVSPLDSAVLTLGTIHGGTTSNVIAEEVRMSATLRAITDPIRDALVERVKDVVEGVSSAYGGSGTVDVTYGYAALVNDDEAVDMVERVSRSLLGDGSLVWKEKPSMGVEDFSFFQKGTSGAFFHLGCAIPGGENAPLHSPRFVLNEDCLGVGAAMHVGLVLHAMGILEV